MSKRYNQVSRTRFELKRDALKKKRLKQQFSKNPSIYESILLERTPGYKKKGKKKNSPFDGEKLIPKKRELFISSKQIEEESNRLRNEIEILDGEIEKYETKDISSPLRIFQTPKNKKEISTMKNLFELTLDKLDSSYVKRQNNNIENNSELSTNLFSDINSNHNNSMNYEKDNDDSLILEDINRKSNYIVNKKRPKFFIEGKNFSANENNVEMDDDDDGDVDFETFKERQKRKMKMLYYNSPNVKLGKKKKRKNFFGLESLKKSINIDREKSMFSKNDTHSLSFSAKNRDRNVRILEKENEFLKEELEKKEKVIDDLQMDMKLLSSNYNFLKSQMKKLEKENMELKGGKISNSIVPKNDDMNNNDDSSNDKIELLKLLKRKPIFKKVDDDEEEEDDDDDDGKDDIDIDVNVENDNLMVTVENNKFSIDNYVSKLDEEEDD